MISTPHFHYQHNYVSQISTLEVPYLYDYKQAIGDKEVIFIIHCIDGIKIVFIDPGCLSISYTYDK